jgi:hypothetical protein
MAITDWTFSFSDNGVIVTDSYDQASTKIEGLSSLQIRTNTSSSSVSGAAIAGWTTGVTSTVGKSQTVCRWAAGAAFGVFAMSQGVASTAHAGYIALWSASGTLTLYRGSLDQIRSASATTLATASPGALVANTIYAVSLYWQYDVATTSMILQVSTEANISNPTTYTFGGLALQIAYTDTAPLTTSTTAGIAWSGIGNTIGANTLCADFDYSQIFYP